MEYRYLGRSALRVSPLCLGTMMFGGATDEPAAKRIIDKARGQGINFLDAADLMGTPPEACLVVEDSRFGVEAARAAGMRALAYAGGGLTPERDLEGPDTVVFHDMADLPLLVAGAIGGVAP